MWLPGATDCKPCALWQHHATNKRTSGKVYGESLYTPHSTERHKHVPALQMDKEYSASNRKTLDELSVQR